MTDEQLEEARRLHAAGLKLVELYPNSKRPVGDGWNHSPVSSVRDDAGGYGLLLAANGLCSVDVDTEDRCLAGLRRCGFDLDAIRDAGVHTSSTRPGSGGRVTFRAPAGSGLRWLKFTSKDRSVGTILELRAASPNLQDSLPGTVYHSADGSGPWVQEYAGFWTLDIAPELPDDLLRWWQRMSEDVEFLREQQFLFVGDDVQLAVSSGDGVLAFSSPYRADYNAEHDVVDILARHDYSEHRNGRWAPPTATGAAAVRLIQGKTDLWQSDHASDPLTGTFDAWTAHVVLDHDGDLAAAEAAAETQRVAHAADGFEDVPQADIAAAREMVVADQAEKQREKHEAKSRWKRAVMDAADEVALQEVVCPAIAAERLLESIDREMLATVVQQRFLALGTKVGIAACRKLVSPARRVERVSAAPEWTEGWVYITAEDKFHRIDSEEFVTAQGFNAKFNRMLPPLPEGELPKTAHRVALDEVGIPTVTRGMYLPWAQPLFTMDGVECVNLYRPSSTPETAERFTPAGRAAIALVERHIDLLAGGRKPVVDVLKSWMAHNVQHPGKKIRWAPLIKGIEGDGKSLIGRLMAAVMGTPNVKDISPKVLNTDFTGWAHKACVGVLEEIRLTGHSRYDVLNALKPNITNNSVAIHAKGQDEFNAINTMNYIAFTNHADALPLSNNDRRFWVIFTPFEDVSGLQAVVGDTGAYFNALFDAIETHRGELRKWLLETPIADCFQPDGRAPDTEEKSQMIGMNVSAEEDALNSALENGGVGIGKNVVVVSYLRDAARQLDPEVTLSSSDMSRLLQKMGWSRLPRQIKWKNYPRRIWHRGIGATPENSALHRLLEATCKDAEGNRLDDELF